MPVPASVASARANRVSSASLTPAAVQAARALGASASPLDHREKPRVLEERQPAGAELVEQRPERLRADRDLRVQGIPAFQVEAGNHGQ